MTPPLEPPAVLLVDDRPENLVALRAVLEPLPCRLVSVTSGEEALKALLQEDFAVVLLDVQMPGMDGFETAELIKGRERTRAVPIIFVTAISKERHHVFRGYSAGAVDYVLKPYDPGVLRSKVAVFLELDAKARAAAQSEAVLRAAFAHAPIGMARLDLEGRVAEANRALASLVGHDGADLRDRLLDTLLHPDDAGSDAERRAALVNGSLGGYQVDARVATAGGEFVPCTLSFSLARPGSGIPNSVIVQVQDLRDRRRAELERDRRIQEQFARSQAERVSERLATIQRISDAALSTLAFDDLVGELLKRTVEALGVDTAAAVLNESESVVTVHQVAGGVEAATQVRRLDRRLDAQAEPASPLGAVASSMATPLVVDGEDIGVLHIGTLFARRFTGDDEALLALAAERAAVGIQRARLFQREHRIAEELQRSLLPARLPEVEGLRMAARYFAAGAGSQVGGDWYDMVVQPDGRLLLIIGDVAGRGIAAASTMGQLRSALRAYALDGHPPASLLERLNAFQIGLHNRGMTTVGLVSVDPAAGELRYAKAGHPPALLVDRDGSPTWLDDVAGVPLGAVDDATFEEGVTRLSPGSTLVLYTDGLVEQRGEVLDRGFERLAASMAGPPEDIDDLCDVILDRTLPSAAVDDDVTLLVLRLAAERGGITTSVYQGRRDDVPARQLSTGTWSHPLTRSARAEISGGRAAGAAARRVVESTFGDIASPEELADMRLVVAEVVNNAVVHGSAGDEDEHVVMHLAASGRCVRVEISSPGGPFKPKSLSPADQPGGFGLVIVDQLTSRWGVSDRERGGVCVWFEMDRDPTAAPAAAAAEPASGAVP